MIGEIDFSGIFISTLVPCVIVGSILSLIVRKQMKNRDLYKFVWHAPLFDLAILFVCVGIAVGGLNLINTILS